MNRRQIITSTLPSLGMLLATNRLALAKMQELATPDARDRSKPEIELTDYSHEQSIYLGVLMTWLEILEDSIDALYQGIDAVEVEPESEAAKATMLMPLGVWKFLARDVEKFEGPEVFAFVQHYATSALSHLGSAADIISTGLLAGSATAITLGTEHINLATEDIGKLMAAMPFARPRRDQFFR